MTLDLARWQFTITTAARTDCTALIVTHRPEQTPGQPRIDLVGTASAPASAAV